MTACQYMMLLSVGVPLIPGGGSFCERRHAHGDDPPSRQHLSHRNVARPAGSFERQSCEHTRTCRRLKSRISRLRALVLMVIAESPARLPSERAGEEEDGAQGVPRHRGAAGRRQHTVRVSAQKRDWPRFGTEQGRERVANTA